jgi:peptidoglycan/xylan/chitin deacetylase (PgdA/CDA1 family)
MRLFLVSAAALLLVAAVPDGHTAVSTRHARPVPILMYHVIAGAPPGVAYPDLFVRPSDFAAQMAWLARHGYHGVTLRQVYDYWRGGSPLPRRPIVVSFDDGYMSDHTKALPVLQKLHWPGVLNLKVGNTLSNFNLPRWRVRKLIGAGWEIDAHTLTHPDLTKVDDNRLWNEVHGSRVWIQRTFHVPVDFFCYPAGRYDAHVIEAVRRAGFLAATTTNYGVARPARPYELSRIRVNARDGVAGFARKLEGLAPQTY